MLFILPFLINFNTDLFLVTPSDKSISRQYQNNSKKHKPSRDKLNKLEKNIFQCIYNSSVIAWLMLIMHPIETIPTPFYQNYKHFKLFFQQVI